MRKTVVSVITGLTVIGSAFAIPSPGDRKKLCESKPFDFVWVEKTQTCVPINPCTTSNSKIRDAYCILAGGVVGAGDNAEEAIRRYAKSVMKIGVDSIKFVESSYGRPGWSLRTTDGGYYVVEFDGYAKGKDIKAQLEVACWAYGKELYFYTDDENPRYGCLGSVSKKECDDMADFASLLTGNLVEGEIEQLGQKVCWLTNFDGWYEQKEKLQDGVIYNNSYQSQGSTIATGVSN